MPKKPPEQSIKQDLLYQALGPAAQEFGEEIRPLGSEVGALAVRATRTLLKPVGGLVWGFEKVEEWIAESIAPKVEKIPPKFRVEPNLIIAGPAIDAMKYCGAEPHLRDMFANLLVNTMDSRTSSKSHPAFVEMVKQLSPDEAKMVKYMARGYKEYASIIEVYSVFERLERNKDGTPVLGMHKRFGPYTRVGFYANCSNLIQIPSYISNLSRLEIITISFPRDLSDAETEELLSDQIIIDHKNKIEKDKILRGTEFRYNTGWIELTPLGEQFLDACVREHQAQL